MLAIIKEWKKWGVICSVILLVAGVYFYTSAVKNEGATEEWSVTDTSPVAEVASETEEKQDADEVNLLIDVKGAVIKPGVYEAKADERVIDIIERAGGFSENADQTKVNLALKLVDEMVVYIPIVGEESLPITNTTVQSSPTGEAKININTATVEDFQELPGIGPSKAAAIIEYREKNGNFKTIEALKEVTGIGDKTFEKLSDSITL